MAEKNIILLSMQVIISVRLLGLRQVRYDDLISIGQAHTIIPFMNQFDRVEWRKVFVEFNDGLQVEFNDG